MKFERKNNEKFIMYILNASIWIGMVFWPKHLSNKRSSVMVDPEKKHTIKPQKDHIEASFLTNSSERSSAFVHF